VRDRRAYDSIFFYKCENAMAKKIRTKKPSMTADEERFMAFEGLLQWTYAVVAQWARIASGIDQTRSSLRDNNPVIRHQAMLNYHTECHFFVIAANKLVEYHNLVVTCGLCAAVDFTEIDSFSKDIRSLRNMREHIIDYFQGIGREPTQWTLGGADASTIGGTIIGGRLDWVKFGAAAERLLSKLLLEPIPYPPR
jgi:hypothetical protein